MSFDHMKKYLKLAIGISTILISIFSIRLFGPKIIKAKLSEAIEARGYHVVTNSIQTPWLPMPWPWKVILKDATLSSNNQLLKFSTITIDMKWLKLISITADGGELQLKGKPNETFPQSSRPGTGSSGASIRVINTNATWTEFDSAGGIVKLTGVDLIKNNHQKDLSARSLDFTSGKFRVSASQLEAHMTGKLTFIASKASIEFGSVRFKTTNLKSEVLGDISAWREKPSIRLEADEIEEERGVLATKVILALDGEMSESVTANIKISAASISGRHGVLTDGPVSTGMMKFEGEVKAGLSDPNIKATLEASLDQVSWSMVVMIRKQGWGVSVFMPPTKCQAALEAIPSAMRPELEGLKLDGNLSGELSIDVTDPGKDPLVEFSMVQKCKAVFIPEKLAVPLSGKSFKRVIYGTDNVMKEVTSGPGRAGWVSFDNVSPYMAKAVVTTEDPSFQSNNGFDVQAIRNSIRENLKDGKFTRGASTITMQLAKNLWLNRQKTASRKVQEFFLTMLLHQKLPKSRILELYLNIIEFGPNLYGIGPAASHYFKTTPSRLSLAQALFLATVLPKPKASHFDADGKLHSMWQNRMNLILDLMLRNGSITDEECEAGKKEELTFGEADATGGSDSDTTGWDVQ